MSTTVCLFSYGPEYPEGGFLWIYLNWALGLRALGCQVIWLEGVFPSTPVHKVQAAVTALKNLLERYCLSECVAVCSMSAKSLRRGAGKGCLGPDDVAGADLLLNIGHYDIPAAVVRRFRRSALVDVDPGLLQVWMSRDGMRVTGHDTYFTVGETVGQPGARFPDGGVKWVHTPPPVALEWWPPHQAPENAPFTTVTHWWGDWMEEDGKLYPNDKESAFLPFLDLPRRTSCPLELAVDLSEDEDEWRMLRKRGWRVRDASKVVSTPWDYQRYIQNSLGEFSCAKPSCMRLENAWISDRTVCYLASGKPAVVQHTGSSSFLPDSAGLFRFHNLSEAARYVETVAVDYERQCQLARATAEEHFDAKKVLRRVLERALG